MKKIYEANEVDSRGFEKTGEQNKYFVRQNLRGRAEEGRKGRGRAEEGREGTEGQRKGGKVRVKS